MLRLILPTSEYKNQIMEYREEFLRNCDVLHGTGGLEKAESFEAWYEKWKQMGDEKTVPEGLVPSTTFLAIDEDNQLVGMIDLRHRLNDVLLRHSGHIGYSVRKSRRRKGYATEMLRLALAEAGKLGIHKVLVTCDKENTGSARTIQKNGGILENEMADGEKVFQRYWIPLTF